MNELYSKKELFDYEDFDLLGMFELDDAIGIQELVTPIGNGKYISRAKIFWEQMTCAEASECREYLKDLLPFVHGKQKFVVLDYMANYSAKVYYEEIKRAIIKKDKSKVNDAKICLLEDCENIINLIEGKAVFTPQYVLPESDDLIEKRNIECNNFPLLYAFTKSLTPQKNSVVLNTGLGGVFIGPFFNIIHGTDWTNMLKSKYVPVQVIDDDIDLFQRIENTKILKGKKVLLLDDNVGTGATMNEIIIELKTAGYEGKCGAVQYNWRNFYLVGNGTKTDITRFNPYYIDYVTPFNYPGHHLMKHAIQILCGERDLEKNVPSQDKTTPWGKLYVDYLKSKNYKNENYCDLLRMRYKGIEAAFKSGIDLPKYNALGKPTYENGLKPETQSLMKKLDHILNANVKKGKFVDGEILKKCASFGDADN